MNTKNGNFADFVVEDSDDAGILALYICNKKRVLTTIITIQIINAAKPINKDLNTGIVGES